MREAILTHGPDVRRWTASILIIGVPAVFVRPLNDPFGVPKVALLAVGVALLVTMRLIEIAQGSEWPDPMQLAFPALFLVFAFAVSWVLSDYRSWALFGSYGRWQGLLPYVGVATFGVAVADAFRGRADELAERFLWSGAVVGAYAVIQVLGLDPFEWGLSGAPTQGISTIGNPNFAGGFLSIVLPIGLGLVLADPGRRRMRLRLLVLVVVGWAVARSQGAWAAGVAGSLIVGGHYMRPRFGFARVAGLIAAGLVALAVIGVVLVNIVDPESRFAASSFAARGGWWIAASRMFMDAPIFGSGPDSFAIEGVTHRTLQDALAFRYDFANDPHSVPLAMLANNGIVGLLAWLAPIGWALWLSWKQWEDQVIWFLGGIAAYVTQALVSIDEISLRVALWTALAGVTCALYERPQRERNASRRRSGSGSGLEKWPLVAGAVLILLGALVWSGRLMIADARVHQSVQALQNGDWDHAVDAYESAIDLRASADYRGLFAVGLTNILVREEGTDPDPETAESLFQLADEAFSFTDEVPYVFSIALHGRLLDHWLRDDPGGDPRAVESYRRAVSLDPLNPTVREELAGALIEEEKFDEALSVLDPLLEDVDPTVFPQYWAAAALAAAETGNESLARRAVELVAPTGGGGEFLIRAQEILDESP